MNNEEILSKALKIAKENGYITTGSEEACIAYGQLDLFDSIYDIIFSHDFAKAFWGEELIKLMVGNLKEKLKFLKER